MPAYGVSQKNNDIGQAYFFSPPPPRFPSFALAPTVRVTISTLPNLPLSLNQRWRLQQHYEHEQSFAHPKYACNAGYYYYCYLSYYYYCYSQLLLYLFTIIANKYCHCNQQSAIFLIIIKNLIKKLLSVNYQYVPSFTRPYFVYALCCDICNFATHH